MAATSQAHEVQQHLAEVQALVAHLETASWMEEDWDILSRVLQSYARLFATLIEAQMTLKRLQALLFGTRRRRRHHAASGPADTPGSPGQVTEECAAGGTTTTEQAPGHASRAGGHRPGVGRLSAEVYVGAEQVACRHEELQVGQVCPVCGQGRL